MPELGWGLLEHQKSSNRSENMGSNAHDDNNEPAIGQADALSSSSNQKVPVHLSVFSSSLTLKEIEIKYRFLFLTFTFGEITGTDADIKDKSLSFLFQNSSLRGF